MKGTFQPKKEKGTFSRKRERNISTEKKERNISAEKRERNISEEKRLTIFMEPFEAKRIQKNQSHLFKKYPLINIKIETI